MSHRPAKLGALFVALLAAAPSSSAQDEGGDARRTLILRDLSSIVAQVESITDASVVVVDDRGLRRTIDSSELLALYDAQPRWRPELGDALMLSLVDGQRVRGMLGGAGMGAGHAGGGGEVVRLMHPILGPISAPLDRVWSLSRAGVPVPSAPASGEDVAVLTNNDVVLGFVVRVGPETVIELPDGRSQSVEAEAIASMRIANERVSAAGPMLWLSDGSAVGTRSVRAPERGAILIDPALAWPIDSESDDERLLPMIPPVGIGQVVGWTPDASRFVALGALPMTSVEPVPPRVWSDPPEIGDPFRAALSAPDVGFAGPCRVEWSLPANADGFTSVVVLPESAHDWGDCELVVYTSDGAGVRTERWRARLNAESPRHQIALELTSEARSIGIVVEPGAYGGVQDTPVLASPLIRLGVSPG